MCAVCLRVPHFTVLSRYYISQLTLRHYVLRFAYYTFSDILYVMFKFLVFVILKLLYLKVQ